MSTRPFAASVLCVLLGAAVFSGCATVKCDVDVSDKASPMHVKQAADDRAKCKKSLADVRRSIAKREAAQRTEERREVFRGRTKNSADVMP